MKLGNKCSNCGTENPANADFCKECGKSIKIKEDMKMTQMVENEVKKNFDEKDINHILSQINKLSLILGFIGIILLIGGISLINIILNSKYAIGNLYLYLLWSIFGVIYLVLAILIFIKKSKKIIFGTGLLCVVLGFFTGLMPILIGIALLHYYEKYKNYQ